MGEELKDILQSSCTRIEIAGGIRRGKPEPHDIELVAAPVMQLMYHTPEEGGWAELVSLLHWTIEDLLKQHVLERGDPDKAGKRAPCGPKSYRVKFKGEKVDIFAVIEPAQWGVIFAIRTGDSDFSHWLVQQGFKDGIRSVEGHLEKQFGDALQKSNPIKYAPVIINTPEEIDVFRALGVNWIEPEKRIGIPGRPMT